MVNDHQVGGGGAINRGVQELWVKCHLGIIWDHCSNMLKTLLRLNDSVDFDETWVKRSLARGFFQDVQKFVIRGDLGVI